MHSYIYLQGTTTSFLADDAVSMDTHLDTKRALATAEVCFILATYCTNLFPQLFALQVSGSPPEHLSL